jgi:hypothetical protein
VLDAHVVVPELPLTIEADARVFTRVQATLHGPFYLALR